jgi:hypothetical protein
MVNTRANKTSKKTVSKTSAKKSQSLSSGSEDQLAAIKRILYSNSHLKSCSCCGFEWIPMGYKVKGMEEVLDNICPKHESDVLKVSNSYIRSCIEEDIPVNRQELEQLISEARGEDIYDEDSVDSGSEDDMVSFDDFRYSAIDDLDYDDYAA